MLWRFFGFIGLVLRFWIYISQVSFPFMWGSAVSSKGAGPNLCLCRDTSAWNTCLCSPDGENVCMVLSSVLACLLCLPCQEVIPSAEPSSLRKDNGHLPWASFLPQTPPFGGQVWVLCIPWNPAWHLFCALVFTPEGDCPDGSLLLQLWCCRWEGTGTWALIGRFCGIGALDQALETD